MISARIVLPGVEPVRMEFPEGKDPFAIMSECWAVCEKALAGAPPVPAGVRDTSRASYARLEASGKLTGQQLKVVEWIRAQPGDVTRQEIAAGTQLGINAVSGRVKELLDAGELEETRRRACTVTRESAWGLKVKPRLL